MSSSDEANSFTSSEVEKLSDASSPNNSPTTAGHDDNDEKWSLRTTDEIVVDVLTPPREEDASSTKTLSVEAEADDKKPGGRLKFFKDGLLCLELLHHDEGQCTKWIQSKAKTFIPPIVRVVKEAKIPHQSLISLFSIQPQNANAEYPLSPPPVQMENRRRCAFRKSATPKKEVENLSDLTFYMKPAPCIQHFLKNDKVSKISAISMSRRPFRVHDISVITDRPSGDESANSKSKCKCWKVDEIVKDIPVTCQGGVKNQRRSIEFVLKKLNLFNTNIRRLKTEVKTTSTDSPEAFNPSKSPSKQSKVSQSHKRRVPRDEEMNGISPIGSSSSLQKKEFRRTLKKPILNVPGAFKNIQTKSITTQLNPLASTSSISPSSPTINGRIGRRKSSEEKMDKIESLRKHLRANKMRFGAKGNTDSIPEDNSSIYRELEQEIRLKRTMSTAISYTINALLGSGQQTDDSSDKKGKGSTSKATNFDNHRRWPINSNISHSHVTTSSTDTCSSSSSSLNNPHFRNKGFNRVSKNDQQLFLRHLLDTSDPIPAEPATAVPERLEKSNKSSKGSTSSSSNQLNHNHNHERVSKNKGNSKHEFEKGKSSSSLGTKLKKLDDISFSVCSATDAAYSSTVKSKESLSAFHNPSRNSNSRAVPISPPFAPSSHTTHTHTSQRFNVSPKRRIISDAALNLSRESWDSSNCNEIIDLSLPSRNRASNGLSDHASLNQDATSDADVPLNLCKKTRTS